MRMNRKKLPILFGLMSLLLFGGCRRPTPTRTPPLPSQQRESLLTGPISLELALSPMPPRYDRLLFLDFTLSYPPDCSVQIPNLEERLEGFLLMGLYERPAEEENGRTRKTIRASVLPLPAPRHRIRPMAVEWTPTNNPNTPSWELTRPLPIPIEPLSPPPSAAAPAKPVPIPRNWRDALPLLAAAAGAFFLLAAGYYAARRIRAAIRNRRLSPQERARRELERLLRQRLPETGRFKEFYFELTAIVRRFIEETTGIRAPEQTTEEFLQAAHTNPRFPPELLSTLRDFLLKADLVKYANFSPTPNAALDAVAAARALIEMKP